MVFVRCFRANSFAYRIYNYRHYSVVFFGSDDFSTNILQHLVTCSSVSCNKSPPLVVSSNPGTRKHGKNLPSVLQQFAQAKGLSVLKWQGNSHLIAAIRGRHFDVGVVASFGRRLSLELIDCFARGVINVHPSLLPRWRGGAPIQHTILSRDQHTGVTVMQLETEKYDEGRILTQKTFDVHENVTFRLLSERLATMGGEMLVDVLGDLDRYQSQAYHQDNSKSTHAHKIPQHWQEIDFLNSFDVDCKFRALGDQFGGLVCNTRDGNRVRFISLESISDECLPRLLIEHLRNGSLDVTVGIGFIHRSWHGVYVKCCEGWLVVTELKMEYKDVTKARDFANAYMRKSSVNGLKMIEFVQIS